MSRDVSLLHPKLQAIIPKIIQECAAQGLPVLVTDGFRSKAEQEAIYAQGRTKPGTIVTQVTYPYSAHNWGIAFDFCRNVRGREYDDTDNFFYRVAFVAKKYGLDWGGDWKNFKDKPHLQLREYMPGNSLSTLIKIYGDPDTFRKAWKTEEPKPGKTGFTDVPDGAWYEEALLWAVENGIIAGHEDGTFKPDDPLTRAQIVSILYRYNAYIGGERHD